VIGNRPGGVVKALPERCRSFRSAKKVYAYSVPETFPHGDFLNEVVPIRSVVGKSKASIAESDGPTENRK
jgi:hypothetical protein